MDSNSNRDRIPAELQDIEETLRANRHEASPLELDRIKLQAIRQAAQQRPSFLARQKGAFMKSRLAMMLVIAAGFMLSTTGAGLAISGSSSSGSAAGSQYTPAGVEEHGNHPKETQGVKGAHAEGGNKCDESGSGSNGAGGNGAGGNSSANGNGNGNCKHSGSSTEPATSESAPAEVEVAPVAAEQQAVVSNGSSLPFTGFVAIPLLIIGVLMVVGGAMLRLKSRKENTVA
jgi:hypothetical protein